MLNCVFGIMSKEEQLKAQIFKEIGYSNVTCMEESLNILSKKKQIHDLKRAYCCQEANYITVSNNGALPAATDRLDDLADKVQETKRDVYRILENTPRKNEFTKQGRKFF